MGEYKADKAREAMEIFRKEAIKPVKIYLRIEEDGYVGEMFVKIVTPTSMFWTGLKGLEIAIDQEHIIMPHVYINNQKLTDESTKEFIREVRARTAFAWKEDGSSE